MDMNFIDAYTILLDEINTHTYHSYYEPDICILFQGLYGIRYKP